MNNYPSLALALVCVAATLAGCEPKPTPPKAETATAPLHMAGHASAARPAQ